MADKVFFGIKNVYYAIGTDDGNGGLTYATPVAIPGARSISLSASGDATDWYADNTKYFSTFANNGYEGDLVVAMLPDSFRTGVLGETLDTKGFYVENNNKPTVEFALLFQFETDVNAIRHCLYRCTASRPAVSSSTIEATKEPQEETITIKAMPLISNGNVKARANYNSSSTSSYALWFSAVQTPSV